MLTEVWKWRLKILKARFTWAGPTVGNATMDVSKHLHCHLNICEHDVANIILQDAVFQALFAFNCMIGAISSCFLRDFQSSECPQRLLFGCVIVGNSACWGAFRLDHFLGRKEAFNMCCACKGSAWLVNGGATALTAHVNFRFRWQELNRLWRKCFVRKD